jgi:quinol monooxygenase YgiN
MPAFRSCTALAFLLAVFEVFAQGPSPLYVVTYVEVKPPAKPEAATLLKSHRDAARRDEGNLRAEAVQHAARPGQFVLLTAWKDQKAYEAHAAAAPTREFRDKLQGLRNSPADDLFHNALSVGDLDGARPARGVYVDAAQGRRRGPAEEPRRGEPSRRRQPALRDRAADQPAESFHGDRDLE